MSALQPKIKCIKNFSTTAQIDNSSTWWALNDSFQHGADACIIRSITYVSAFATKALYTVHCNFLPYSIGCVINSTDGFVSNSQREIKFNNPNPSQIRFWLQSLALPIANAVGDTIHIEIDFITYEK